MKLKLTAFVLVLCLCAALCGCTAGEKQDIVSGSDQSSVRSEASSVIETGTSSAEQSSSEVSSKPVSSSTPHTSTPASKPVTIEDEKYLMTLVNPWVPLPEGFKPDTTPIPAGYGTWANMSFADVGFDDLIKMMDDARSQGASLILVSSTRTTAEQTALFNNKVNRVMAANPSYTRKQAEIEAAKAVAIPGTSEHQLGLAVDFNSTEDSFRYTKEYKWLQENCYKYGFIYRYPDDKQATTGIIPEPWHYRYVGKDNAKKIYDSGLVFEEYLANNGY